MRRIVGIVIFVIGLLLLVGYLAHVSALSFPTIKWLGWFGMLIGVVVVGLSFIPKPASVEGAPAPMSAADGIVRVFYEPAPVFKNLRYYPRWLAAFLILVLCGVVYQTALVQRLGPERFAEDQANRIIEAGYLQNAPISPEQFKQMQIEQAKQNATLTKITSPLWAIGLTFVVMVVLAGLFMLGVLAFGGRINFWSALSVAVYSALPPTVISSILSLILLFIKSPDDIIPLRAQQGLARADLGLLFSPADHPYLYTLAGFIGLFTLYKWWLAATGLKNAGEKISSGSAWAIAFMLWLLGMLVFLVLAMLAPAFVA